MKIAVLTEILSTHSGSRAPLELAMSLAFNNQVVVLAYSYNLDKKLKKKLEKKNIKVIISHVPCLPLGKFFAGFKFIPFLKKCDIVSFHGTPISFLAAKLSGKPIAATYYGTQLDAYYERFIPNQKITTWQYLINCLANQIILGKQLIQLKLSRQTIAISRYTSKEAKRLYNTKIPYIYLGTGKLTIPGSKVKNQRPKVVNFLSVSRLTPYKGFHLVIKAFKKLNEKIPKAKLVIVGSAPSKKYLKYLKAIKNKNVIILNDVSDQKLTRLYRQCDIYVTADRYLFFGLPLIEAASFGKPTVAFDFSAASEIVRHNQTGYVAKTIFEFTNYLKKLASDNKLRIRFGQNAIKRTEKLFNWKIICRQYENLFKRMLSKHKPRQIKKLLIATTLVISLIFGLPHLLIPLFQGGFGNYQPLTVNQVPVLTFEETFVYAGQAREVYDGHPLSADFNLIEYKNLPVSFFFLPALIAGSLGCLLDSVPTAFVLFDFLLPPLIFLSIYFFLKQITRSCLAGILAGVLVLTTDRLFLFLPPLNFAMIEAFWQILTIGRNSTTLLEFSRYPHPQLSFFALMLYLNFFILGLKNKKIGYSFLSGIFLGLLFYTYIYYWTFALTGTIILFLICLIQKKHLYARLITINILAAFLISVPHWILFLNHQVIPAHKDILERMGLEIGRFRNFYRTAQYLVFSLIIWILIRRKNLSFWLIFSFISGGIVCLNIQLITGYTSQSWHWVVRALNPLSIIVVVYLFHQFLGKLVFFRKSLKIGLIILVILLLLRALLLQFIAAKNSYQGYTLPKSNLKAFAWLNQNTPKDSVVASPSFETNCLIPAYTHNNVFLPFTTIASNREITERFLLTSKIFGRTLSGLAQILAYQGDGLGDCRGEYCLVKSDYWEKQMIIQLYYMKYLRKNESLFSWSTYYQMPLEEQKMIKNWYEKIISQPTVFPLKYQLDYLYYGPAEKKITTINLDQYSWLQKVYDNNDVAIYKVQKN